MELIGHSVCLTVAINGNEDGWTVVAPGDGKGDVRRFLQSPLTDSNVDPSLPPGCACLARCLQA